ncbi:unnamed protein product, partial [Cochlearia groenlandica]
MEEEKEEDSRRSIVIVSVIWKGNEYEVEMGSESDLKELGFELRKITGVKPETLRLIVPRLNQKGSILILPFSDQHSSLSLRESYIVQEKTIRMLGVSEEEVDGILKDATPDMRILGFEEEEKRLRQKKLYGRSSTSIKLPQGTYIFCGFRTLQLPGIQLNPPASEALKRMHMLAADPGIIAVMNKHRWRVGIMTELAPVGYVGVSPRCLLGFNKNQGEEISLRLRTDDLKGFRKYASIKKTLLHELAHMVYTDHDDKFYALDSQLNKEAESLDWTKSRGHTLNGTKLMNGYDDEEDEFFNETENLSHRLGGNQFDNLGNNARESSVTAAYLRLSHTSKPGKEPDPDDNDLVFDEIKRSDSSSEFEPDPDDTNEDLRGAHDQRLGSSGDIARPAEDDDEPEPDDLETDTTTKTRIEKVEDMETTIDAVVVSDESSKRQPVVDETMQDPNDSEPCADNDTVVTERRETIMEIGEPDPDDHEIQRIQDSVRIVSNRIEKAISALDNEASRGQVLQMLLKIVRNIIEQPYEMKFKRLRKGNPAIKRNIINFAASVEILSVVGFVEEMVSEGRGGTQEEPYLVMKRNDPGLLWIAKSIIESHTQK